MDGWMDLRVGGGIEHLTVLIIDIRDACSNVYIFNHFFNLFHTLLSTTSFTHFFLFYIFWDTFYIFLTLWEAFLGHFFGTPLDTFFDNFL